MPITTDPWPQGTPAWVDLMASDFEQTKEFYTALWGWEYDQGGEEFGYYATARLDGNAVAGLSPTPPGMESMPSNWTTYLAVDELDSVMAAATGAGASVVMPPMTIADFGGMAMLADPTGAVFGLWRSGTHTGVDVYNEPGTLIWNEVMVSDVGAGQAFYAEVFGYGYADIGTGADYQTITLGGQTVAGIGDVKLVGEGMPSHWRTYFGVADIEASCARVVELGGAQVTEPWDTPFGRVATVTGPSGEMFLLNQPPG